MIFLPIGIGQCGNRVVDALIGLDKESKGLFGHGGIEIIRDAFAVNTDEADLRSLKHIKFRERGIIYGESDTRGHGVGGKNEQGAVIARKDGDKVLNAINEVRDIHQVDAFLLIASTGGGTGSGGLPVLADILKNRYRGKPVYTLAILPFASQEENQERCLANTATCLKAVSQTADAVILVDNELFKLKRNTSLEQNLNSINFRIAQMFYDLLRAGEERVRGRIGSKTLDAGDIQAILKGWTTLGFGRVDLPRIGFSKDLSEDTLRGMGALEKALNNLSLGCDLAEAGGALFLISAPKGCMNIKIVEEIEKCLKEKTGGADIKGGDYPQNKRWIDITLLFSQLAKVDKVKRFFEKYGEYQEKLKSRVKHGERGEAELSEAAKDVPDL